ncbi:hypothetical protein CALVIDRAFT_386850 [Calocera viscosa TUFC12733]|uniref:Uncharacterized protein n=1 Tax=Calocera viscosa (strain TUFC12733) TaxID=1330018 RepID=A0A167GPC5_CALVF|nr:hypothetical protein CALVIDRAFT_386850 [Calocera viscosa TUFC12733]
MFPRALLCILALLTVAVVAPPPGGPSCTPGCTCPLADQAEFPLGDSETCLDPITCYYPSQPGSHDHTFYCTYDKTLGTLITDADNGVCEPEAICLGPARRRNLDTLPRAPKSTRQDRWTGLQKTKRVVNEGQ